MPNLSRERIAQLAFGVLLDNRLICIDSADLRELSEKIAEAIDEKQNSDGLATAGRLINNVADRLKIENDA